MAKNRFPGRVFQRTGGNCHLPLFLPGLLGRYPLPAHQPGDPGSVPVPFRRGARVVATDRGPRVAIVLDAVGKHPGPDLDVCAWIGERFPWDAHLPQSRRPRGVDLHETEVVASIGVVVNGSRVEVALPLGDGPEEAGGDAVHGSCLLIAEGVCRTIGTENGSQEHCQDESTHNPPMYIITRGGR